MFFSETMWPNPRGVEMHDLSHAPPMRKLFQTITEITFPLAWWSYVYMHISNFLD